jgi:hypothetical protein
LEKIEADVVEDAKVDVNGRMLKAIDGSQRFNRWGKHYLRAITRSHQLMQ